MFDDRGVVTADISAASDQLRAVARRALQGKWRVEPSAGGVVRVVGRDGQEAAALAGPSALGTAQYVAALRPEFAYELAELLFLGCIEIRYRSDQLPSRLQAAMHDLAKALPRE